MSSTTAVAMLISAAAVVGSLPAAGIAAWFADTLQFGGQLAVKKHIEGDRPTVKDGRDVEYRKLKARFWAVLVPALVLWLVVITLLGAALRFALNELDPALDFWSWEQPYSPFLVATCALALALVVVPVILVAVGRVRLGCLTRENDTALD